MDGIEMLLARAGEASGRAAALAAVARDVAEATRAVAVRVQRTEGTPWRSVAAELFRDRGADLAVAVRRGADAVDDAAGAVSAHAAAAAARVEHLEALLRSLERALESGMDDVAKRAHRALEEALPGGRPR